MKFDYIGIGYKSFILFNDNLSNELHETVSKEMSRSSVSNVLQLDRFIDNNIKVPIFYSVRKK
jgi:hypothetical protein